MSKKEEIEELNKQIKTCQKCGLCKTAVQAVPGIGNQDSDIMFIGEAPGFYEDQKGEPFVGNAGHLLDNFMSKINLDRTKVFITNIVKHRPPQNRDPKDEEILACKNWLDRQLEIIKPKLIVTLGRISLSRFIGGTSISRVAGQERLVGDYTVFPLFHPAAALRDGNIYRRFEEDFMKIPQILEKAQTSPDEEKPNKQKTEQTMLF